MEERFRKVAESVPSEHIRRLREAEERIPPGGRFRVNSRVTNIAGHSDPALNGVMESLLVAVCGECRHLWQYHHFRDSVSRKVRRKIGRPKRRQDDAAAEASKENDNPMQSTKIVLKELILIPIKSFFNLQEVVNSSCRARRERRSTRTPSSIIWTRTGRPTTPS